MFFEFHYIYISLFSLGYCTSGRSSLRKIPYLIESHNRHNSLCNPGSCTSARSSLRITPCLFESHCRHTSLWSPGSCTSARSSLRRNPCCFESHFRHICLFPAGAQLLKLTFGHFHVYSSLTFVTFPYIAPVVAQVLEVAFWKELAPLSILRETKIA